MDQPVEQPAAPQRHTNSDTMPGGILVEHMLNHGVHIIGFPGVIAQGRVIGALGPAAVDCHRTNTGASQGFLDTAHVVRVTATG